jgi:methylglutamate dehydrogenase subunit D
MPECRSALAGCLRTGTYGAADASGPDITIGEVTGLAIVQVAAFDAEQAAAAIAQATGASASLRRCSVAVNGAARVLWIGPGRWLVCELEGRDLASRLAGHCKPEIAAITDLSCARTTIRIEGKVARSVLAKLCTLDFDPPAFPSDTCAQTQLGQIGALLDCRAADVFDVVVYRGFAVSAWEMLTDAALEFGYQVR